MKSRAVIEREAANARETAGQHSIPVDPIAIALAHGAEIVEDNFADDLSGILIRRGSLKTIAINQKDSLVRRRFTIAHECGHLILAHEGEIFVDKQVVNRRSATSSLAIDEQEIEANQFAASLLMPRDEVVSHLDQLSKSCSQRSALIELMARSFGVSKKAMEYRLVNLGLVASPDDDDF
ncbi:ImmA/IrrE family metallo-endopeptidase [Hylemonella sp. W303a]|uniref:ImmA/IrrE family metallo-endopeptidase n=1 Tax=Hylemonella sp. W303a TaxID=3389873 RepID=UPI00396B2493